MSLTWSLQALLVRHEAYVVEAEREKASMVAEIERLSLDKRELEVKNDSALQENRDLMECWTMQTWPFPTRTCTSNL